MKCGTKVFCFLLEQQRVLMNKRRLVKLVDLHDTAFEYPVKLRVLKPEPLSPGASSLVASETSSSMTEFSSSELDSSEERNETLALQGVKPGDPDFERMARVLYGGTGVDEW